MHIDMEGWYKIHRTLLSSPIWLSQPFTRGQAWVDLIGLANHEDGSIWVRGVKIPVKRGQVGWSEVRLANRWKWSRAKTRSFLKMLENELQIEQQTGNVSSIISIQNYELYQNGNTKMNTKKTAERQQKDTNKNEKKDKNIKGSAGMFNVPSIEEIRTYCQERNNSISAETFFNHYESKGWMIGSNRMRDWQAAIRSWEARYKTSSTNANSQYELNTPQEWQ